MISVRSYLGHLHDIRAWALIEHHSHRLARQVKITGFVTTGFFNTFVHIIYVWFGLRKNWTQKRNRNCSSLIAYLYYMTIRDNNI